MRIRELFQVEYYMGQAAFDEGINHMAMGGWTLHSWQQNFNGIPNGFTVVFVRTVGDADGEKTSL